MKGEAGIAWSVWQLATGWKVRGSNPGGARFSALVQTGSGAHPASCTIGIGSFMGVKRPGRDADHTPSSSAEVNLNIPRGVLRGAPLVCYWLTSVEINKHKIFDTNNA